VTRPVRELKGFKRITLQPGETKTVIFKVPVTHLAFYNRAMALVVEPGTVDVMVGSSSADIRASGTFEITGSVTPVEQTFTTPVEVRSR
jgi:beta-glucosidase